MYTYFTIFLNLVRMGVRMKTFFSIVLFLCFLPTYSQVRDSLFIYPGNKIEIEGKKILLNVVTSNENRPLELLYFDGQRWNKIPEDTLPFRFTSNSRFTPSKFSQSIFMTSYEYLWEYDGNKWIPHSIKDSLDGIRHYDEIIELPDSSFVLFSTHYVKRFDSTSSDSIIVNYKELQKFKSGTFTTLNSTPHTMFGLKKHRNETFSYTAYHQNPQKTGKEILTFSPDGQLLRRDRYPDLTPFGYNQVGGYVYFQDYLLDSKGSFWYVVFTPSIPASLKNARIVEVTLNGEIYLYNEENNNINIPPTGSTCPFKFDIDEEDNIYFDFYYRGGILPDGKKSIFPSIFKLHANRTTLTEFIFEDIIDYSIWYCGGNTEESFEFVSSPHWIKFIPEKKSILLSFSNIPLLQFFPENVLATVKEQTNNPIQLYPNPVQSGNTITIESSTIEKVNNPLFVVIRDISGATVRENIISAIGNLVSIKTEGLSRGTYFVSILNNNKTILQTSFVKE